MDKFVFLGKFVFSHSNLRWKWKQKNVNFYAFGAEIFRKQGGLYSTPFSVSTLQIGTFSVPFTRLGLLCLDGDHIGLS